MPKRIDLTGRRFGRLVVQSFHGVGSHRASLWKCLCDCGKSHIVRYGNLVNGDVNSCGCYQRECFLKVQKKSGTPIHGLTGTPEYICYLHMIKRCNDVSNKQYDDYGGRGISVCKRWMESFTQFIADMGPKPTTSHTIERIDNDGNYEPSNCRWATYLEQAQNRRSTRNLTFGGVTHCLTEWARQLGMNHRTLGTRLDNLGWPIHKALTTPVRKKEPHNANR